MHGHTTTTPTTPTHHRSDWKAVRSLLPHLWEFRGRVLIAIACLVLAKLANVGVPFMLKDKFI